MNLDWLKICAEGQADGLHPAHPARLSRRAADRHRRPRGIGVRSRDFSTATIALMPVAIAINIAIGSIIVALRLPIYLDSVGTVLVGALAGPWAGALTGLLANLIWSILPVPGGAGPTIAFFAPVAGGHRPDGRLLGEPRRLPAAVRRHTRRRVPGPGRGHRGGRASPARGPVTIGLPSLAADGSQRDRQPDPVRPHSPSRSSPSGSVVAWLSARTRVPASTRRPDAPGRYLSVAAALTAVLLIFAVLRLLFGPTGYFSTVDGVLDDGSPDSLPVIGSANLTGLAIGDPGGLIVALAIGGHRRRPRLDVGPARRQRPAVPRLGRRPDDRPGRRRRSRLRSRPASSAA